jgi:hypothetical protein
MGRFLFRRGLLAFFRFLESGGNKKIDFLRINLDDA